MRIIDAHAHLIDEPRYVERLLATMDACGIERVCLSGLGRLFGCGMDDDVRAAFTTHPDRIIGATFVRPGVDGPEKIDRARDQGFRMVKVSIPRIAYDDPAGFPLWQRAADHAMPVLFHTGVITTAVEAPSEGISSWLMHPMRIEPITRAFPDLKIIIAHMGIHWNHDAAELARMRENVYVDLTGEPGGWRERMDAVGVRHWLWWPGAFEKVCFGTDVHYTKIRRILDEDGARLDAAEIDPATRRKIFAGNILHLLGDDES